MNLASLDTNPHYNYASSQFSKLLLAKGMPCKNYYLAQLNYCKSQSGVSNYTAWTSIKRSIAASNTLFWMSGVKPPMFIGNYDNNNYNCGVVYPISNPNYMLNCSTTNAFVLCDNSTIL
jgi:hypothetical protein